MTLTGPPHVAPRPPGESLLSGRYALRELLAHSAAADVFLAYDQAEERSVGVKWLSGALVQNAAFMARFDHETDVLMTHSHPNLVSVLDVGESAGRRFVVTEYLPGGSLAAYMWRNCRERHNATMDPFEVARLGSEVAAALDHATRYGVIHRDLRPAHILLTPDLHAKVGDWGIAARDLGATTDHAALAMQTATYISPEHASGAPLSARSDIYSLGIVLYHMATGRPPFVGASPSAVAEKHRYEEVIPPRWMHGAIPAALEAVILRALAKNPAERYGSAAEFRVDLDRVGVAGAPAAQTSTTPPRSASTALALAPARSTALIGEARAALPPRPQTVARRTLTVPAPGRTRRRRVAIGLSLLVLAGALAYGLHGFGAARDAGREVIPNVAGMNVARATQALQRLGLDAATRPTPASLSDLGRVLSQSPAAKGNVARGTKVILSIGAARTIATPDVANLSLAAAESKLSHDGLHGTVDYVASTSPAQKAGVVLGQRPASGKLSRVGDSVVLDVVKVSDVAVPELKGLTLAEAAVLLQQSGLVVGAKFSSATSSTIAEGLVIGSQPNAPAKLAKGATVQLVVSGGAPTAPTLPSVAMPAVVGDRVQVAARAIKAAGLNYRAVDKSTDQPALVGRVLRTAPRAGSSVAPGTVVVMTVWSSAPSAGGAAGQPASTSSFGPVAGNT